MPQNWKTYKLGEISTEISYGYTASASSDSVGPKFLRITDIQQSHISWENVPFCQISEKEFAKYKLKIGDIVIARTGNSTGANAIVKDEIEAVYASYLIRYQINTIIADPLYVSYVLRSKKWFDYVDAIKGGSAQPGANAQQFAQFEISLPPLPEQRAIASILSALDDKIELNLQMNKTLEEMAMALYKHWFVDFGPFKDGEFVESEIGMIPKGWEIGKLNQLLEVKYGKDHKKLENGTIPCYGSGGIMRFVNTHLYDKESILIPRKGSLSNLFYMMKPFWSVDTMFYSKFKLPEYGKYVFHFLKTQDLASMDVGSAIPSLTTELLNKIDILIPNQEVIIDFDKIVKQFFTLMESNKTEISILKNQRDSLLPKLIKGDIRLNT